MKRMIALLFCLCLLICPFGGTPASAASPFAFSNGKMSKETLRAYCSRAVTLAGFCTENTSSDPVFEDDLRMLLRIGAKYIGRAAYYSWGGNLSYAQIEEHYKVAAERAALAHKADPEMILQAGVFEIIYRGTVNNTPVPAYVFEAFGKAPEKRNFRYEDMVFTSGEYAVSRQHWGNGESAVPNVSRPETQMYFYWQITRYIDAGFESVHLGQACMMAEYDSRNYVCWDTVTSMARAYAKGHARRGLVLFDAHDYGGMKVGDRLICDINGSPLFPNESAYIEGAYQCEIRENRELSSSWIGTSKGGEHPLGFYIDENFMILEFDNYDLTDQPNVATPNGFHVWGYDDITWFALQPAWYRNQFLEECHEYLTTHALDKEGRQQYFLQAPCRRVILRPVTLSYTVRNTDALDYVLSVLETENAVFDPDGMTFSVTVRKDYRANTNSDGCPIGFGQEDIIREIFLGRNAPENPAYTGCAVPGLTTAAKTTAASSKTAAPSKTAVSKTAAASKTTAAPHLGTAALPSGHTAASAAADTTTAMSSNPEPSDIGPESVPAASDVSEEPADAGRRVPIWRIIPAAIAIAAAGVGVYFGIRRKQR